MQRHILRIYDSKTGKMVDDYSFTSVYDAISEGYLTVLEHTYYYFALYPENIERGLYSGSRVDIERYRQEHGGFNSERFFRAREQVYRKKFPEVFIT